MKQASIRKPPLAPILFSFAGTDAVKDALASFIVKAQREAIAKKGRFTIALSGGSLPKMLAGLLDSKDVKWEQWQVFYADERIVPLDHADSNHSLCMTHLFSKTPKEPHVHTLDPTILETILDLEKSSDTDKEQLADACEELSDAYEQELIREFAQKDAARFPVFDLILLGMGPDGHTASLFPAHPLLTVEGRWVAYIDDSPKSPPKRITLTLPVINHASRVAFVCTGKEKAEVLHTVLDEPAVGLPASRVRPVCQGQLYWFTDDAATEKVEYARTQFQQVM